MPVIKSAKKKLRQDKKRTAANSAYTEAMKSAVKAAKKSPTEKTVSVAFTAIDKAAKKFVVHKNKAARMKSSLSHLLAGKSSKKEEKSTVAKAKAGKAKKAPAKKTPSKKNK